MCYEARKCLKTATDGSLNINHAKNTFITDPQAAPFAAAMEKNAQLTSAYTKVTSEVESPRKQCYRLEQRNESLKSWVDQG